MRLRTGVDIPHPLAGPPNEIIETAFKMFSFYRHLKRGGRSPAMTYP